MAYNHHFMSFEGGSEGSFTDVFNSVLSGERDAKQFWEELESISIMHDVHFDLEEYNSKFSSLL